MTILSGVRELLVSSFCQIQQLLCSLNQYLNEPKKYYGLKLKYRIGNDSDLL